MNHSIGENIKKLRKSKSMTQDQLAEWLHVTHQAISSWETGKTQPDIETLKQMAEVFDVTIEELIYGEKKTGVLTNVSVSKEDAEKGITFGAALAMVISYVHWRSIGWAIFHGLLGWVYVIYYYLKYVRG